MALATTTTHAVVWDGVLFQLDRESQRDLGFVDLCRKETCKKQKHRLLCIGHGILFLQFEAAQFAKSRCFSDVFTYSTSGNSCVAKVCASVSLLKCWTLQTYSFGTLGFQCSS